AWSIHGNITKYRLLVILRPPPGHSFILDTLEQLPASRSGIRVVPKCTCSSRPLFGCCFLHSSGDLLARVQVWYLLDTLCTGTYLDVKKVSSWVQMLVPSAWQRLPQSSRCQLTELPSRRSCRFQLTAPSGMLFTIEMRFAVQ
ncbi:IPIL1 protein, partial [Smithornis capensis]|nr:IPIL1 protein [Smithornis capensis]